jgi:multicomponent Na+:H+ antiporter subunit D
VRESRYFYLLHQFVLVGINGAFVTGDFFNLFVFFEIMLLASFVMVCLGARAVQLNQAFVYVLLNLIASAIFLAGVGAMYGTAGTVNMAETARRVAEGGLPPIFWAAVALVLVVFAIKAALIPLFFWLPDAYPEAPIPVSAFFAGLLTKVGVYTLFRSVPLLTGSTPGAFHALLLFVAAATMLIGVLGALGPQQHPGDPVVPHHLAGRLHDLRAGDVHAARHRRRDLLRGAPHHREDRALPRRRHRGAGGRSDVLGSVRGMARTHPWVAVGFFIPAMALAGLPPFSGFWGKFFLIVAGFQVEQHWAATTIAVLVGLLTLASMMKIWTATFWGEPEGQLQPALGRSRGCSVRRWCWLASRC